MKDHHTKVPSSQPTIILCDECGTKCNVEYDVVDEDEFHTGKEKFPVGATCPKCGWHLC